MRHVRRGAVLVLCLGVASLWAPIWPGIIETKGHTYGRDEHGRDGITGPIYIAHPIRVPFWESNFYRLFKANDSNLLLLVP